MRLLVFAAGLALATAVRQMDDREFQAILTGARASGFLQREGPNWRIFGHPQAGPQHCDPAYECAFEATVGSAVVSVFDFSGLCSPTDYFVTDSQNHTFFFNICGFANQNCNPNWETIYEYGVAVQMWGATPPCNGTGATQCLDAYGVEECCTANCEVLGVGQPEWSLIDSTNPATGGVLAVHTSVPESSADPYPCPIDPRTGGKEPRSVAFSFACQSDLPRNLVNVSAAYENTTCNYVIQIGSAAACGCLPQCEDLDCGDDSCFDVCGTCPVAQQCLNGVCCQPDCRGRSCGDDGCGGSCGTCPSGNHCSPALQCVQDCLPNCVNKNCGGDGCGGVCGSCADDYTCNGAQVCVYSGHTGNAAGAFFGGLFTFVGCGLLGLAIYGYRAHGDALHSFRGISPDPRKWCQRGAGSSSSSSSSSSGSSSGGFGSSSGFGGYGSSTAATSDAYAPVVGGN